MARRKYRVLRVLGWIVLSFLSLILIITLGFYLGRGWIMNRAVSYINHQQPGEIRMGKMNLIPFMNFPDVSLQLRSFSYYEREQHPDSLYQEPILSLNEVLITLDVVNLVRGNIQVSQIDLKEGFLKMEIYGDTLTNLEKGLGLTFIRDALYPNESQSINDSLGTGMPLIHINLEQVALSGVLILLNDQIRGDHLRLMVNHLESSFSYLPEKIDASLELNMNINSLKYLTYNEETDRNILFESIVSIDPNQKLILVEPSRIEISGLELETWGTYSYMDKTEVDFQFKARNEGLEVLNYLLRGVLNLDEIEQIGSGSIQLSGSVLGELGEELPVISMTGSADRVGFKIKSIQKDVTDISFNLFATNGGKLDMSEAMLRMENFTATFPEGKIQAHVIASNMVAPELEIKVDGEVNLSGMEEMIRTDLISSLEGNLVIKGDMDGILNRESGKFFNDQGYFSASLQDVGFVLKGDSLRKDEVRRLNGELFLQGDVVETRGLEGEFNGNKLQLGLRTENFLPYLLGKDQDVRAKLSLASELLNLSSLTRDSTLLALLGEELKGMHFQAEAMIKHQELDAYREDKTIPKIEIILDSFSIVLPSYADIAELDATLTIGRDTIALHHLHGIFGESEFNFSGLLAGYGALLGKDSMAWVSFGFDLTSELIRAEDFFTLNDEFLLPPTYQSEYLQDFHLKGFLDVSAEGILDDSLSMDFYLNIGDLAWNFRDFPLAFEDFAMEIQREGERLMIKDFRGQMGKNNLKMTASLDHFTDTVLENLSGNIVLESDYLDFNELMNFHLHEEELPDGEGTEIDPFQKDSSTIKAPPQLNQIAYPQLKLNLDIGELHYGNYNFYDLKGGMRISNEKTFFLDELSLSWESGGSLALNGLFNVSSPQMYTFSAKVEMKDMNVDDLDIPLQSGDSIYTLKENFDGLISADGIVEIFITPDLKVDMAATTAMFNVQIKDGALINFTPLNAAAKFLDNRDLNYVKFATLRIGRPFTLMESKITVPLMNVESTMGQMLIEGEQGLDGSFLYLLRIPPKLAREAAKSMLSDAKDKNMEDEIQEMGKKRNFYVLTVWSNGIESDFKLGDRRNKFTE